MRKKHAIKKAAKPADNAVGTLERGLAILQFFKRTPEASVADVAAALELSRSTTYRIAERLRELGFLEINASNALWRLGRETAQLGVAALQSTDLMRIAPPVLLDLLEGTREAVNLAVFDSDSMVLIFREQGPQSVTISSRLGSRRPMHASSLGKAYMAALRAEDRHALIERLEMKRFTPETIVDPGRTGAQPDQHSETRFCGRPAGVRADVGVLCRRRVRSSRRSGGRHQRVRTCRAHSRQVRSHRHGGGAGRARHLGPAGLPGFRSPPDRGSGGNILDEDGASL